MHGIDLLDLEFNSVQYLHILIEALRLAFADSTSSQTLNESRLKRLASEILRGGPGRRACPRLRTPLKGTLPPSHLTSAD